MSEDLCCTCGKAGTRLDSAYTLGPTQFTDSYCGWCGVTWGRYVKPIADEGRKKAKPTIAKANRDEMLRFGR